MRVAVVVASIGRAEEIGQLLVAMQRQTLAPSSVILSVVKEADLPQPPLAMEVVTVMGTPGLPAQRNRGLELALPHSDIIVFYDDDFVPARDSLESIAKFFTDHPEMAGATGYVIKDSVRAGGLPYEEALQLVAAYEAAPKPALVNEDFLFAYENLPRYAWQEDMDFAAQLSSEGKVIRTNAFAGVHRGVKTARSSGKDFGFSQIVNPVYLVRKGTMTPSKAWALVRRNFVANHVKLLRPEPYVDRWGRLQGNWAGSESQAHHA